MDNSTFCCVCPKSIPVFIILAVDSELDYSSTPSSWTNHGAVIPGKVKAVTKNYNMLLREIKHEVRAQMAANDALMNWDAFLESSRQETTSRDSPIQQDYIPHLVNLNEGSMFSGVIKHYLQETETTIQTEVHHRTAPP